MASSALRDELLCSICLNIYTDPVTLRCGHNFCRDCIDQHLKTQDGSRIYSCPECRAKFQERPVLQRNIALHNVSQRLRSPQPHQEEITGIFCTYCIHSPVPAVKSCLHCEASLCDDHLNVHSKSPEHILTDPSTSLENRKCSVHKKILEYYCTEDAACICVSCRLDGEHQGHQVEKLDEASEKKKLRNVLQKLITEREETEGRVQSLEDPTDILLDVNTAGNNLLISDDLKTATWTKIPQNRPETAERFLYYQVMSRRRFTSGRHYWDVEICRSGEWRVGMCYPSVDRRGCESFIGKDNKSWSLCCRYGYNQYSVLHDSKDIWLPLQISSDTVRIRICLDYGAGQLSFYELCDPIRHLHTFTTTFTEPLHAALCAWGGSIKILGGGRNWKKPS